MDKISRLLRAALLCGAIATLSAESPLPHHTHALKPPMGWNSWDCFATTVTEAQTRANADYMARHLKQHGWEYVVVDIQWYEPGAAGYDYRQDAVLVMDEWGRLLPAPNRFPSTKDGAGFKPLADHVHGLGLKFGLHLMRGIPRQAVEKNLPVKGTAFRARDIANTASICTWNPDMYGVDMTKPGAQAYYDSVFELLASWGVDFVKVDDISRPYHDNEKEIEAIRAAIDKTGRPMVLSLSPGETALSAVDHVVRHANMWRISDDFWDNWPALFSQFKRLENWNPHRRPGAWPDADMLPLGVLDLGRRTTRFTRDEQYTLMSLWSIARSPLMHGGDMAKMDDFTLSLLTNDEVLAVNQASENNRPLFNRDGLIGWIADVPYSKDKYVALFNARDRVAIDSARATWRSELITRQTPGQGVPIDVEVRDAARLVLVVDDGGDGLTWDHAVWSQPRVLMADGSERRLTDLKWTRAETSWGEVSTEKGPSGRPMRIAGQPAAYGIGAHAHSIIEYELPAGAQRFLAFGAMDDAAMEQPRGGTFRLEVHAVPASAIGDARGLAVAVALREAGFSGPVRVRDLWRRKDLGVYRDEFAPVLPWHGSGLYRFSTVE
jgi:Alpha-galactosidase